jgi:hypothetical protein
MTAPLVLERVTVSIPSLPIEILYTELETRKKNVTETVSKMAITQSWIHALIDAPKLLRKSSLRAVRHSSRVKAAV